MPELPEVETTVKSLLRANPLIVGSVFIDVWTDCKKIIKSPKSFNLFKKRIKGKKIKNIWRKGKNIIFDLSNNESLLIHQKMTGHLLYGKWIKKNKTWQAISGGPLRNDPANRFLHLIFWLKNGQMIALSDMRKFAKVGLWPKQELLEELKNIGPDPFEKGFNFEDFEKKILNRKTKIKQALLDQTLISGIGNIYADEILWTAKIHPFRKTSDLDKKELRRIFQGIQQILKEAIKLKGTSIVDYRLATGEKGSYQDKRRVYKREGKNCPRHKVIIKRVKMGNRSCYFCPKCQSICQ